jgi:hypothetical protein
MVMCMKPHFEDAMPPFSGFTALESLVFTFRTRRGPACVQALTVMLNGGKAEREL